MSRRRLDQELLRRELATSRGHARELIDAGRVLVGGAVAHKAARMVDPGDALVVTGDPPRFVSRGGEKLEAALGAFGIEVRASRVLDAGASTGGFTDCLLQRGASRVVAVDVGHGQLHERLRADPRVEVHERTNVRDVEPGSLGAPFPLVVADLSFISLRTVLPALVRCCAPDADLVLLVKPQFEAGRVEASRGRGVIRDPEVWARVLGEVMDAATEHRLGMMGLMVSPLHGADGNTEFLLHARLGGVAVDEPADLVAAAVADAVAAGSTSPASPASSASSASSGAA